MSTAAAPNSASGPTTTTTTAATTTSSTTAAMIAQSMTATSAHPLFPMKAKPTTNGNAVSATATAGGARAAESMYTPPVTNNAIDSVLDEISDLLQAAYESQSLGRLRNSYSCLLLAHQRLVGVGRRVDRSYCEVEIDEVNEDNEEDENDNDENDDAGNEQSVVEDHNGHPPTHGGGSTTTTPSSSHSPPPSLLLPPLIAQPPLPTAITAASTFNFNSNNNNSHTNNNSNTTTNEEDAYVEYLARSGMELHHKRTGRGLQHEAAMIRAAHVAKVRKLEEEQLVQAARGVFALSMTLARGLGSGGGGGGGADGDETSGKKGGEGSGGGKGGNGSAKGKKRKKSDAAASDDEEEDDPDGGDGDDADNLTPTRKKGGRGKKPPTLVMHTMAGRNLDVRELMRGIL